MQRGRTSSRNGEGERLKGGAEREVREERGRGKEEGARTGEGEERITYVKTFAGCQAEDVAMSRPIYDNHFNMHRVTASLLL